MSPVSIITLVPAATNATWLDECVKSVARSGADAHEMVPCSELYAGRRATYTGRALVGCVDYDDRISPDAIQRCREAMYATGAGVAFTWQRLIDPEGAPLGEETAPISPRDVCSRPNSIHHFALMQSALLPEHLFDVIEAIGAQMSVDWIVRAYLALRHGAVQVPMLGYDWRQHENQTSRVEDKAYGPSVRNARALIKTWAPSDQALFQPFKVAA